MNFDTLVRAMIAKGIEPSRATVLADWYCNRPRGTPYPRLDSVPALNKAVWDESKHKRDNSGKFSSTGGDGITKPRSSSVIRSEISRLERVRRRPDYGAGLTDEDRRAISKLDEMRLSSLRTEHAFSQGLERQEQLAQHKEELARRKALREADDHARKSEQYEREVMASSLDRSTEDLVADLDDDETPPRQRKAIRKELAKRGVDESSYDYYRWTDTGCEAREARIESLRREFDHMQNEQQRWQGLSLSHKDRNMRKKYARRAQQADSELDAIERALMELESIRDSNK